VPPSDQLHLAAFGFHLGHQRGLLFDGPFSPSLDPCDDLNVGHADLLLELQKESPATQSIGDSGPPGYTSKAGRLRKAEVHRRKSNLVVVLDPFGKNSDGFNPIAALQLNDAFPDDALELAEAVIRIEGKEPHCAQAAQELVAAIIMYVRLVIPNGSFSDVRELLSRDDQGIRILVRGGHNTDPKQLELWEHTEAEKRDKKYMPPVKHRGKIYPGMII